MSLKTIRNTLKALLLTVDGIGVVHDYERWSANWSDLLKHYESYGRLNGWALSRKASPSEWTAMPEAERRHTIQITGIYSLNDAAASELVFQDLIEAIVDQVNRAVVADPTFGGACLTASPLEVKTVEPRMFGEVLCHYCELTITVTDTELYQ